MLAAIKARCGDLREIPMRGRNHHGIDVGRLDCGFVVGHRTRAKSPIDLESTVSCRIDRENSHMA
jgi:hypothetical protein